jgi:hypothetical protein
MAAHLSRVTVPSWHAMRSRVTPLRVTTPRRTELRRRLLDEGPAAVRRVAAAVEGSGAEAVEGFGALQAVRAMLDEADPLLVEAAIAHIGSVKGAAEALGLPLRSMWNRIEKAGLETPGPQRKPVSVETVRRKLQAEIPVADIAAEFGVSRETVYRRARAGRQRTK